jgi:23S rRNA (uracil1939-C5)-methyltransferase
LADLVESWLGIELDQQAIKAARRNAAAHQRSNGEFLAGSIEDLLPEALRRFDPGSTAIIIDPPRTGCPVETLQWLRRTKPAQILYVSCNPATLARDLNILCAESVFDMMKIVPLDMFPQTQHVECVADLRLNPAGIAPAAA